MGTTFSTTYGRKDEKVFMRYPDLAAPDTHALVCELITEIGEFERSGIVSLGPVGVGKSSNLNTVASYLSNRLEQQAASGDGATTLTVDCRNHVISYQGRPVKWKWMDTPGDLFARLVEKWKGTELPETSEDYVSPEDYDKFLDDNLLQVLIAQQIGCVMAMISAVEIASQTSRTPGVDRLVVPHSSRLSCHLQVLKHLYRQLVRKGMRMICVITKVDLVDEDVAEDVAEVQTSHITHLMRQCVSQNTGLPLNQVHPVVNLVLDFDPQANLPLGHLALFNVRSALRAARHANLPPMPGTVTTPSHNWSTLTVPSPIISDDGVTGRSHPVGNRGTPGLPPHISTQSGGTATPTLSQSNLAASPMLTPGASVPSLPFSHGHLGLDGRSLGMSQATDIDLELFGVPKQKQESRPVSTPVLSENDHAAVVDAAADMRSSAEA